MLKIPNMLLAACLLGALAFSARERDMFEELRQEPQRGPVSKRPKKPVPDFEYHIKPKIDSSSIKKQGISKYRKSSACGEILVFDEMETVKNTLKYLEEQVEKYEDAFLARSLIKQNVLQKDVF